MRQDTKQLLEQVDIAIKEFNTLRPLSNDVQARIKMAFLPDRVTSSLNMEGIVATRRQTLAIMDSMTIIDSSSKSEQEVLNALSADELTIDAAEAGQRLNAAFLREIHALIEKKSVRPRGVIAKETSRYPKHPLHHLHMRVCPA